MSRVICYTFNMRNKFKPRVKLDIKRKRRKPIAAYFFSVIFLVFLLVIIFKLPPNQALTIKGYKLPIVPIFFIDLYLVIFFFVYFISSKLHATLIAAFIAFYLLLRYAGLTHPVFFVITLALLVTIELFFYKRK